MRTDYIIRIIEQFVQAIASIILRRKEGNYEQALKEIQASSRCFLRQDIDSLLLFSGEQIVQQFKDREGNIDFERCILCADLIYEQALIYQAQAKIKAAIWLKIKCLYLYRVSILQNEQFQTEEYLQKLQALEEEIKNYTPDLTKPSS